MLKKGQARPRTLGAPRVHDEVSQDGGHVYNNRVELQSSLLVNYHAWARAAYGYLVVLTDVGEPSEYAERAAVGQTGAEKFLNIAADRAARDKSEKRWFIRV